MATSSILHNFTIADRKNARLFVKALNEASELPPWRPSAQEVEHLRDPEAIRELMKKRKKTLNEKV